MMKQLKQLFAGNRRSTLFQRFDRRMMDLHHAFENLNYDSETNGERFVLTALAKTAAARTVFDVGANIGEWTAIASGLFPQSQIHSFEIVPQTFRILQSNCSHFQNVTLVDQGLADEPGTTQVNYWPQGSGVSTCVDGFVEEFHHVEPGEKVEARVTTGDAYCRDQGINTIDFLKIDVEGLESKVLRGFADMLTAGKIRALQFEYGYGSIFTKFLLKDFYDLLTPYGMVLGKIYPKHVDFREYRFEHEDFIGPNFLAVHKSETDIINALKG